MTRHAARVLVILDNCHEADAIRLIFSLQAIRGAFPVAEITLLVNERAAAVFERLRPFDRLVTSRLYQERMVSGLRLRSKKLRELARLVRRVGIGYDLAITLGTGSTLLNLLARLAAGRSVGFSNRYRWLLSTDLGRYDPYGDPAVQHLRLLRACGVEAVDEQEVSVRAPGDDVYVVRLLREHALADAVRLIVLHPGSDWACQQWLVERWAEFADALIAERGASVVFTGLASEAAYIASIQQRMRGTSVSLAGATTLPQLEALIAGAQLCVCVDSAVYDLALATGTPVVVLAGPSDAARHANGRPSAVIVNRTPPELRDQINRCKEPKDIFGGCLNYDCPMAGLRPIAVSAVLHAVALSGVPNASR